MTLILSSNKGRIRSSSSGGRPDVVTDRYVEQEDYCGVRGRRQSVVCASVWYLHNIYKCTQTDIRRRLTAVSMAQGGQRMKMHEGRIAGCTLYCLRPVNQLHARQLCAPRPIAGLILSLCAELRTVISQLSTMAPSISGLSIG